MVDLREYLTVEEPLGPISMDDVTDPAAVRALFDGDNALDEAMVRLAPAFIVGRRGAGKTTFLRSSAAEDAVTAELGSTEVVSAVARTLVKLRREFPLLVDETARVWDYVATCAIAVTASKPSCELPRDLIRPTLAFVDGAGGVDPAADDDPVSSLALRYLTAVRQAAQNESDQFSSLREFLDSVEFGGVTMGTARQVLFRELERTQCLPFVHIDSLEDLTTQSVPLEDPQLALALQGLFRHVGNLASKPQARYRMRTCFPAELWHTLSNHSSNPIKDFKSSILLHWTGSELLHVAAKRLLQSVTLNHPAAARSVRLARDGGRRSWDSSSRVLMHFLPSHVTNDFSRKEPTLSYILRHTQLLPRHLILILNTIFANRDLSRADSLPTGEEVTRAVRAAERQVVHTVINAHKSVYPQLERVCSGLVSATPLVFSMSELHRIFNRSSVRQRGTPEEVTYKGLQRMLLEVGALGRLVDETDTYHSAEFEFHQSHKLIATEDDAVCWHPLFAERFDCKSRLGRDGTNKTIYPLGAAPDDSADLPRVVHLLADQ